MGTCDTRRMIIQQAAGVSGAATATGPTIIIDVFRAYSAAAYAFDADAAGLILTREVDGARQLAKTIPNSVLMGEVDGVRPEGFSLGNSPGEIVTNPDLVSGKTIIHRSSAGTQCALAALDNGAGPVLVSSLVVASATVAALEDFAEVTIVSSGLGGIDLAEEDMICAQLLADLLLGGKPDPAASAEAVAATSRATELARSSFAHPDDVALCSAVDRFSFAMLAAKDGGVVRVSPLPQTM